MKILQIVGTLDRWSVEAWLLRMLEHARRTGQPADWTFYCTFGTRGERDAEALSLGANVIHAPVPIGRKLAFAAALRRVIGQGDYEIVHSHHDLVSGLYLASTVGLGVRKRLIHVHNPDESVLTESALKQRIYRPVLRTACLALADAVIANSNHSLDTFLAGRPRRPGRDLVQYLGIDPSEFRGARGDRTWLRRMIGVSDSAPVMLFAGRITPEKNPVFCVDVLAALRRSMPEAIGVFVGDGSLEADVRARAVALGQEGSIRMLGWRRDVADIMSASDWFILPHPEDPMEGFGLAVVEAQLAGLRLLLSKGVSDDPLLPTAIYRRLSLSEPVEAWARAAVDLWSEGPPSRSAAFEAFDRSPMQMDHALANLLALYQ